MRGGGTPQDKAVIRGTEELVGVRATAILSVTITCQWGFGEF